MNRKLFWLFGFVLAVGLTACAAVAEKARGKGAPGFVTGGVESLIIEGPSSVSPGGTITLKAVGYDAESARIKVPGVVKPQWSSDNEAVCSLETSEGESVVVKGLSPGVCYITAKQGKADTIHAVEVK